MVNEADTTETSQEPTTENGATSSSTIPTEGELYKITVINDTIKSPRKLMQGTVNGVEVKVNYGSPSVKGRTIFGDLVPYGKVWRMGANEASQVTFGSNALVGEQLVPAGTYSLFSEPADKNNWTIILNKVTDQWGAYDYDASKDVARATAKGSVVEQPVEQMDFSLSSAGLELHWADLVVTVPIKAAGK